MPSIRADGLSRSFESRSDSAAGQRFYAQFTKDSLKLVYLYNFILCAYVLSYGIVKIINPSYAFTGSLGSQRMRVGV